jgi:hypothetical protein
MGLRITVLFLMTLVAAGSTHAAGIGVRAGTTGFGADVGWRVVPTVSARVGYSALSFDRDINSSDLRYDGKLKLSNLSGLIDWSPLGPFRITGGIIGNDNKIDVIGRPSNNTFTINGTAYQASQVGSLSGSIKAGNRVAPYLGIGYGNVAGAGINFYFDLGVMFQGAPKSNLSATCGTALSAAQCAQLQNDVALEARRLDDKVNKYKYYPVASIGITIGF